MKSARSCLVLGMVFCAAGCGGPAYYPVRGTVTYVDGTPLDGGWVYFEKTEAEATHSADSPLEANGHFELRTARPGDGVPPGKYRVVVKPRERVRVEGEILPPLIDPKFERYETSGIELVVEAKANLFAIKVAKPE